MITTGQKFIWRKGYKGRFSGVGNMEHDMIYFWEEYYEENTNGGKYAYA